MNDTNPIPQKLAFYLRVSTQRQEFRAQLHALRDFCRRHRWGVPRKELMFAEKISGITAKRTQLDRLLHACRSGLVDTVVCYQFDRLGRRPFIVHSLLEQFRRLKIRVVSAYDGLDTYHDTPELRLYLGMLISFGGYERDKIAQKTTVGIAAKRRNGETWGRRRTSDDKIARAEKLKTAGELSLRDIAKKVGLDPGYLSRVLNGKRPKT